MESDYLTDSQLRELLEIIIETTQKLECVRNDSVSIKCEIPF